MKKDEEKLGKMLEVAAELDFGADSASVPELRKICQVPKCLLAMCGISDVKSCATCIVMLLSLWTMQMCICAEPRDVRLSSPLNAKSFIFPRVT